MAKDTTRPGGGRPEAPPNVHDSPTTVTRAPSEARAPSGTATSKSATAKAKSATATGPGSMPGDSSEVSSSELLDVGGATVADFSLDKLKEMRARAGLEPGTSGMDTTTPGARAHPRSAEDLPDAFGPSGEPAPGGVTDIGPAYGDPTGQEEIVEGEAVTGAWGDLGQNPADEQGGPVDSDLPAGDALADVHPVAPGADHWDDFDDDSGWDSVTGQRRAQSQPGSPSDDGGSPSAPAPEPQGPEYSRQETNIYGRKAKPRADEGARLVCIKGADEGREFQITGREMTVGRDPRNDIVLEEASASRMHGTLLFDGEKYSLVDNDSGNGTFVNGQKVDRIRVRSGDEIRFGNGVYRFLEIGDVFKPVDASGAPILPGARRPTALRFFLSRNGVAVAAGILVLAALAVVTVLILRGGRGGANPEMTYRYYMQGIEAFKRRDWAKAETHFTVMVGHDPSNERGQRYLQAVAAERRAVERLNAARSAIERGDLVLATSGLKSMDESVYAGDARELQGRVDEELDNRVAEARKALEAGQGEEALRLLRSVEEVRPGRPDVAALTHLAQRATGGKESPPATVEHAAPSSEPVAPAGKDAGRPQPAPTESAPGEDDGAAEDDGDDESEEDRTEGGDASRLGDDTIVKVRELVGNGKLSDATKLLDSSSSRDALVLKKKIEKFEKVYRAALADHREKKTASAIKQLKQARAYEQKITGGSTPLSKEILHKTADMHYIEGREAQRKEKPADAYKSFKQALALAPDHPPTRKATDELEALAKELFEAGYQAQSHGDTATAKTKWKLVLQIVPASSEVYKKAKQRLGPDK